MENTPVPPTPEEQNKPVAKQAPVDKKPRKKKKSRGLRTVLKILIWIVVIAGVIFLTLELTWRIAVFGSMLEMLEYIRDQLT
jgi:hypothetical protein